ncbi:MAG: D-aminoacylase [Actinobacteria bacterium]|nr:D-aminoacylase [Actinomycetota bacterium]
MYDLLIVNGRVITGQGNPWFKADVAIRGDKIVRIGHLSEAEAKHHIDAEGRVVSPGFIDAHSHSDLFLISEPTAEAKVMQGVTTENVGMDGMSVAPIKAEDIEDWRTHLSGLAGDPPIEWTWRSFADYLDVLDSLPTSDNVTSYAGLGTIRLMVMGTTARAARPEEIEQMKLLAARAMEEGARGISSGLIYPPSQYQTVDEVAEIARAVTSFDGIYNVHIRSEGHGLLQSVEEVIEIGRRSGIPVVITHFKAMGKRNWGLSEKALSLVDKARNEGIDVTIEQYPYTAASTMFHAVIPPWYHAQGPKELVRALKEDRDSIKKDIAERTNWENWASNNGWDHIVISSVESEANKAFEGKSVAEIARIRGLSDPTDAALDLLAEENLAVGMVVFCMDEGDIRRIMRHPTVNFITDGLLGGKPHPRVYGTFPRVLGPYVRDEGVLGLEQAVRKITSLPAEKLRLRRKGVLAAGYDADIVVFEPTTISDRATFDEPRQFPVGVDWVIVNGQVVVDQGQHTGARPGRTVRTR